METTTAYPGEQKIQENRNRLVSDLKNTSELSFVSWAFVKSFIQLTAEIFPNSYHV